MPQAIVPSLQAYTYSQIHRAFVPHAEPRKATEKGPHLFVRGLFAGVVHRLPVSLDVLTLVGVEEQATTRIVGLRKGVALAW